MSALRKAQEALNARQLPDRYRLAVGSGPQFDVRPRVRVEEEDGGLVAKASLRFESSLRFPEEMADDPEKDLAELDKFVEQLIVQFAISVTQWLMLLRQRCPRCGGELRESAIAAPNGALPRMNCGDCDWWTQPQKVASNA